MAQTRDWQTMKDMSARLLKERTGEDVVVWAVDLGLRLEGDNPGGRLTPSKIHETMPLQISLTSPEEVDVEVLGWLEKAFEKNS